MTFSTEIPTLNTHLIKERLREKGIMLPEANKAVANYIPSKKVGNLLYISGQLPLHGGKILHPGIVGDSVTFDAAVEASRQCAINIFSVLCGYLGEGGYTLGCVRLGGFVACIPSFAEHPQIINGASDLIADILGEAGRHTRASVGVASLPLGACVEVDAIFEVI